jgi:hypothetical protein
MLTKHIKEPISCMYNVGSTNYESEALTLFGLVWVWP